MSSFVSRNEVTPLCSPPSFPRSYRKMCRFTKTGLYLPIAVAVINLAGFSPLYFTITYYIVPRILSSCSAVISFTTLFLHINNFDVPCCLTSQRRRFQAIQNASVWFNSECNGLVNAFPTNCIVDEKGIIP